MKWNFTPFNLKAWNESKERVLFVAAEPNGNNPNSGNPDMGDWFRTANSINKYHNNRRFYNRCRIILKGILSSTDEKEIFSRFRFMDLKATQGGASSSLNQVIAYVNLHLCEVLEYFLSSNKEFGIAPTIIVVLGNNAQDIFERTVKPALVSKIATLNHIYLPHPSAQTVVNEHLTKAASEINSKLIPVTSMPYRWFCNGRKKHGWTKYNKRNMLSTGYEDMRKRQRMPVNLVSMKNTYNTIYRKLHAIYDRYRRRYRENSDSRQMCCMWSTYDPPDIIEGTEPFSDIEAAFDICIDEDDALKLYDMDLDEATRKVMEIREQQC